MHSVFAVRGALRKCCCAARLLLSALLPGPGACRIVPPSPTDALAARGSVAFTGVNVLPMTTGDRVLQDQTVLVQDGLIAGIGSMGSAAFGRASDGL